MLTFVLNQMSVRAHYQHCFGRKMYLAGLEMFVNWS